MTAARVSLPKAPHIPDVEEAAGTMEAALAYVGAGLYIGPLRQGSKNPGSVLDAGHQRGSGADTWPSKTFADAENAVAHFSGTDYGMFLHCGRTGVVALDVDAPERVPEGWWPFLDAAPFQSTRADQERRGHYLFLTPAGRIIGNATGTARKGWGEVRGANGVVVIAPTRHEKGSIGGRYAWVRTGAIPVLPALISDTLPEGKPGEASATDADVVEFMDLHRAELAPSAYRDVPLIDYHQRVERGESRHEAAIVVACWLARNSAAGWYPAQAAMRDLGDAFAASFTAKERTSGRGGQAEFDGVLSWAIGQVRPEDVAEKQHELSDLLKAASVTTLPSLTTPPPAPRVASIEPPAPATQTTQTGDEFIPDDEDEPEADRPTWARVDLDDILAGRYERPMPTVMAREDGAFLFYAGKVNALYGESESGKSWVMQWATAELLKAGKDVLYVDFEDDPGSIVNRLLDMGVPAAEIRKHFDYRAPERSPASALEIDSWWDMLARPCVLAVIDGVTDSMGIFGKKINDNDEVGDWFRSFPTLLARRTGAAVVIIDHVSKDSEHRGRFAIGAQHKLSSIKGAAYLVDIVDVLGVGRCGVMTLRVTKDRPGQVRGRSGPQRKTDRTQETARFVLDSTGARPQARLAVWEAAPTGPDGEFRPTGVMQSVSEFLERSPDVSQTVIEKSVRGRAEIVRQALDILAREGFAERRRVSNTQHRWFLNRPYRQVDDPSAGDLSAPVTTLDVDTSVGTDDRKIYGAPPGGAQENLLVQSRPAVNLPVEVTDVLDSTCSETPNMIHNPVPPRPVASGTGLDVDPQPRPVGPVPEGGGATGKGVGERPAGRDAEPALEAIPEAGQSTAVSEPPCPCGKAENLHSRGSWRICRNGHRWHAFGHRPLARCPQCPEQTPDGDAA